MPQLFLRSERRTPVRLMTAQSPVRVPIGVRGFSEPQQVHDPIGDPILPSRKPIAVGDLPENVPAVNVQGAEFVIPDADNRNPLSTATRYSEYG